MSLFDNLAHAAETAETRETSKLDRLVQLDRFLKEHVPKVLGASDAEAYSHFCPTSDPIFGGTLGTLFGSRKQAASESPFVKDSQGTFVFGIILKVRTLKIRYVVRVGFPDANSVILGLTWLKSRHTLNELGGELNSLPLKAFCQELHDLAMEKLNTRFEGDTIDANRFAAL